MANPKHSGDGPIIIKKYANRRLYNTAKSSYVTLEDLSQMVQGGEDFQVFDAKTGEDITRSVLAQIIFEQEAKGQNMLPTNFLRQLIRLYGDALQSVVPGYLDASMEAFSRNQERMREAFGQNPAMASFETLARSNMEFAERAMRMFGPFGAPGAAGGAPGAGQEPGAGGAPSGGSGPADIGSDIEALQRKLAEMQAQLQSLGGGQAGAAPGAAPSAAEPEAGAAPASEDAGKKRGRG
ncbi:hypothetical protein LNKW23_40360 [Paralimibaculum aggregatum]|uniref:Polyhydroxyalkanoate synthesis repressor PhaR n=1 Tax=Paralimibaculum aggregatum TaxID=3036245 RepID=A0ABQ6LSB1_9RHOB|nr:polyhydroxyalkanoate synthesis repressor PhaR [Limibaculum sp. NKW23]GMG84820.1 hypothetical protein LNKW23_40360 [Limibaculum sp. NKW23]